MEHLSAQFQVIFSLPEAVMAFLVLTKKALFKVTTILDIYKCGSFINKIVVVSVTNWGLGHVCSSSLKDVLGQQKSHIKCFASALCIETHWTENKLSIPPKVHSTHY